MSDMFCVLSRGVMSSRSQSGVSHSGKTSLSNDLCPAVFLKYLTSVSIRCLF